MLGRKPMTLVDGSLLGPFPADAIPGYRGRGPVLATFFRSSHKSARSRGDKAKASRSPAISKVVAFAASARPAGVS
jgi:hypothetical protein